MDPEEPIPNERKARKSVAFTDEQVVFGADGSVTMVNSTDDTKETAVSHTPRTPPLSAALGAFADPMSQAGAEAAAPGTAGDDEAGDGAADDAGLDLSQMKKKKKKKKTEEEEEDEEAAAAPVDDGGLDLTIKKKKKKKVKEGEDDDFASKLKALDLEGKDEAPAEAAPVDEGDMEAGTGVWAHDDTKPIVYNLLLHRFFSQLSQRNPDHALGGTRSYKIPPPQCGREGNKKTLFANIAEISKRMNRTEEHVQSFLLAELGTSGSVDGNRRLIIKGRFQQKQIENVLRKYIIEYVTCRTCKSPDTLLERGENRLYFITCNSCGSRRSVTAVKSGFSAQIGKRKKMQG